MKNHSFRKRLGFALAGLAEGWRRERSFRTHLAAAALAVTALCLLRPAAVWWAIVILVVAVVLAMELLNGALEALIDRLHPDVHPQIRVAKDMAAGSVLIVAIAALLIAAALMMSML
jgi:diacylglycerol kinase (ATP)